MRVAHYNVTMVRICAAAAAATAAWRASIVISFALPDGSVQSTEQSTEDDHGHSIVECEECAAESNKNVRHLGFFAVIVLCIGECRHLRLRPLGPMSSRVGSSQFLNRINRQIPAPAGDQSSSPFCSALFYIFLL